MNCFVMQPTNYLKKTGGTMTGNLVMAAGKLVDGVDISEVKQTRILTGTYVGNGADNRSINIGINLASKANVWVNVKDRTTNAAGAQRVEFGQGDSADYFSNLQAAANLIQSLTATGFQVGSNDSVNQTGSTYIYVVVYEEP